MKIFLFDVQDTCHTLVQFLTKPSAPGKPRFKAASTMSVRAKIAEFGGAASTSKPNNGLESTTRNATSVSGAGSNGQYFANYSTPTASGDVARKVKVPDTFKNASKPAGVPAAATTGLAASFGGSAPVGKWGGAGAGPESKAPTEAPLSGACHCHMCCCL